MIPSSLAPRRGDLEGRVVFEGEGVPKGDGVHRGLSLVIPKEEDFLVLLASFEGIISDFHQITQITLKYNAQLDKTFLCAALKELIHSEREIRNWCLLRKLDPLLTHWDSAIVPTLKLFVSSTKRALEGELAHISLFLVQIKEGVQELRAHYMREKEKEEEMEMRFNKRASVQKKRYFKPIRMPRTKQKSSQDVMSPTTFDISICFLGGSGCGKSTLIRSIIRDFTSPSGSPRTTEVRPREHRGTGELRSPRATKSPRSKSPLSPRRVNMRSQSPRPSKSPRSPRIRRDSTEDFSETLEYPKSFSDRTIIFDDCYMSFSKVSSQQSPDEIMELYDGSDFFVLMFNVAKRDSFKLIPNYVEAIRKFKGDSLLLFMLVGKFCSDLPREISSQEAGKVAQRMRCKYMEINTLVPNNLNEMMTFITKQTKNYHNEVAKKSHKNPKFVKNMKLYIESFQKEHRVNVPVVEVPAYLQPKPELIGSLFYFNGTLCCHYSYSKKSSLILWDTDKEQLRWTIEDISNSSPFLFYGVLYFIDSDNESLIGFSLMDYTIVSKFTPPEKYGSITRFLVHERGDIGTLLKFVNCKD
eukprot:TRINITY_DN6088_c0_g1_i2.p1 TRINITY_DN6088_c0_g1~~TRINITY_DN6088_c0_g1_i2.p1  ORF type:complete len:583 (-),score=145.68 TRINITY_DN6088_c0_g1_i2:751-2499(-)